MTEGKADKHCSLCLFRGRALTVIVTRFCEGKCNKMTQDAIEKMEEKVLKDGSLSEERKTELLKLLKTLKTEKKLKMIKER
jgi:hypothetical protein